MKPDRARSLFGRLALALAGTLFALLLAEIALRIAPIAPTRYARPRHLENDDKSIGLDLYPSDVHGGFDVDLRNEAARARYASLGVRGLDAWRRVPVGVAGSYNADRCRDAPRAPRRAGVSRVLVLGDSFSEGQGVRQDATFARVLEHNLQSHGLAVEVINCGRRGRDFPALYDAFEALQPYEADVVVYAMVLNDAVQSAAFHAQQQFLNDWIVDRRRTLGDDDDGTLPWWRSRFVSLLRERNEARRVGAATTCWYRDMYGAPNAAGWSATQSLMARMNAEMRSRGGRFVVELLPLLVDWRGGYPFADVAAEIARACEHAGIPFHDAWPALSRASADSYVVHPIDRHPNESAHALIAADAEPLVVSALRETAEAHATR